MKRTTPVIVLTVAAILGLSACSGAAGGSSGGTSSGGSSNTTASSEPVAAPQTTEESCTILVDEKDEIVSLLRANVGHDIADPAVQDAAKTIADQFASVGEKVTNAEVKAAVDGLASATADYFAGVTPPPDPNATGIDIAGSARPVLDAVQELSTLCGVDFMS